MRPKMTELTNKMQNNNMWIMKLPHTDSVKKTLEVSDMSFFFFSFSFFIFS